MLYRIPYLLGHGEHWPLHEREARVLAERTERLIKALPKRTANKWLKAVDKHLPGVSLVAAAATISAPRVIETMENRKRAAIAQNRERVAGSNGHANGRPAHTNGNAPRDARTGDESNWTDASAVPLSREQIQRFFDGND